MRINLPFSDSLISRACRRFDGLHKPGGARDQAAALVGLAKALADGVAEEVQRRLSARFDFVAARPAAAHWTPPQPLPAQFPPPAVDGYDTMTVVALKDEARRRGIPIDRRVKKSTLIGLLRGSD